MGMNRGIPVHKQLLFFSKKKKIKENKELTIFTNHHDIYSFFNT